MTSTGARFATLLSSFLVRTVLIYALGEEYVGVESVVASFMQLLSLSELGLGSAVLFRLYKPAKNKDRMATLMYLAFLKKAYLVIGAAVLILGFAFSFSLPALTRDLTISTIEIHLIFWAYVVQMALSYWLLSYRHAIFQANQKGYVVTAFNTGGVLIGSIGQMILYVVFHNYLAGLVFSLSCLTLAGLLAAQYARKKYPLVTETKFAPKLTGPEKKSLIKDIYALSLTKLCKVSNKSVGTIVISSFSGAVQAGFFSNYQMIMTSVDSLLTTAFSSITASVGNLNATEDDRLKNDAFQKLNFLMFFILAICGACVWNLTNPFVELVWGSAFLLSQWVVLAIAIYIVVSGFLLVIASFKEGSGIFWQGRYRPLIGFIFNIVFSIVFMQFWGIVGVIWTAVLSRVLTESWFDPLLVHKHTLHRSPKLYFFRTGYYMLLIVVSMLISGAACAVLPFHGALELFANLLVSVLVPFLLLSLIFWKTKEYAYYRSLAKSLLRKHPTS